MMVNDEDACTYSMLDMEQASTPTCKNLMFIGKGCRM